MTMGFQILYVTCFTKLRLHQVFKHTFLEDTLLTHAKLTKYNVVNVFKVENAFNYLPEVNTYLQLIISSYRTLDK